MSLQHQPGTANASLHVHQATVGLIHCYQFLYTCVCLWAWTGILSVVLMHSACGCHGFLLSISFCLMKANSHSWVSFTEFVSGLQLFPPYFYFYQWRCWLLSCKVKLLTTGFISLVSFSFATSLGVVPVCPGGLMLKTTAFSKSAVVYLVCVSHNLLYTNTWVLLQVYLSCSYLLESKSPAVFCGLGLLPPSKKELLRLFGYHGETSPMPFLGIVAQCRCYLTTAGCRNKMCTVCRESCDNAKCFQRPVDVMFA